MPSAPLQKNGSGIGLITNETPVLMSSLTPGGLGIGTLIVVAVNGRQGAQP